MADPTPRPLVDANVITEFGGIENMESFKAEGVAQRDYTYVPGFSEMRVKRDRELGEYHRHEIKGKDVSTLPVNVRWFRTVKGNGSDPDQMRVAHAKNLGYRPMTKEDIGKPWLTGLPPGAIQSPDGTIKSAAGDLGLYVIDQAGAARNAMRKKIATENMVDGMEFQAGGLGEVAGKVKGVDPHVTKQI